MQVATGSVVTLAYDLTKEDGEIIESSDISGPITFLVGRGAIIKGLDAKLVGLVVGDERTFEFPPEEAFGRPEDAPTRAIARKEFPAGAALAPGSRFEAGMGPGQTVLLEVARVDDAEVHVRMLHPLAGQRIGMSVKILGVRDATSAEQESGRAATRPPPPPPSR